MFGKGVQGRGGGRRNVSIEVQASVFDTQHLYPISLFSPSCALSRVLAQ